VESGGGSDDDEYEMVPPDGGWGWLVLAGSVLVNILVPGTVKSFGVLFVEFLEVFNATPAAAAWIPALCYFLYSSLGQFHKPPSKFNEFCLKPILMCVRRPSRLRPLGQVLLSHRHHPGRPLRRIWHDLKLLCRLDYISIC